MDLNEYLTFATSVAAKADALMKQHYGNRPKERIKADKTIVTAADEEINQMVIDEVHSAYPDHSVDGEEASVDKQSDYVWVCDPIDGTNPFSYEMPISVFSLALVHDGDPVVAVVSAPFSDRTYTATKGGGAFVDGTPLKVSDAKLDRLARMNFDWWNNDVYPVIDPLVKLSRDTGVYLLSPGSTTHMGIMVARGAFVASVFPGGEGKNVDVAATSLIVEEAGGKATDLFGNKQRYDQAIKGSILSNGVVHDQIVEYIGRVVKDDGPS